jgi:hypothetical protein
VIFERRQYTLRPGRVDDFWAAQRRWNVHEASAALMGANLSYFSTVAGTTDQIVHLYRFDSVGRQDRRGARPGNRPDGGWPEDLTSQFRVSHRWHVSGRIPLPPYH